MAAEGGAGGCLTPVRHASFALPLVRSFARLPPVFARGAAMPTIQSTKEQLSPKNVLDVLSRHILVDGYHVVMDMERSQGSYLYDARSDRPILDFFSCFATIPVGYNHPKMKDPEFR